jgi:ribosomal protein L13E
MELRVLDRVGKLRREENRPMSSVKAKVFKEPDKQRFGKGFSKEELRKAGTSLREAAKNKIPVDPRRRTAHEGNIQIVKALVEAKRSEAILKRKPKKAKPEK